MKELAELEVLSEESKALTIGDTVKAALRADLGPVAERMANYTAFAATFKVCNKADADSGAAVVRDIDADLKAVKSNMMLLGITNGLYSLHRKATAFRALFTDPMERDKVTIRRPILAWQAEQDRLAKAEEVRLQAIEDEKTRKAQEALQRKAEKAKTPEKAEALREQAAMVPQHVVQVTAPKADGLRSSRRWLATMEDEELFFQGLSARAELRGYVDVQFWAMSRNKANLPTTVIPGIRFELQTR